MERKKYHVVPGDNCWLIRLEHTPVPLGAYARKSEAVSAARAMARLAKPSQLFVHGRDGRIQEEFTYGGDPPDSPG